MLDLQQNEREGVLAEGTAFERLSTLNERSAAVFVVVDVVVKRGGAPEAAPSAAAAAGERAATADEDVPCDQ